MSQRTSISNSTFYSNSDSKNKYNDVTTGVVEAVILDDSKLDSADGVTKAKDCNS